jgi:hypothetical protein
MKRITWFAAGMAAGASGAAYATRKVKKAAAQLAPTNVARRSVARVRTTAADVADAVREGREAMHVKEAELRARLDGTPPVAGEAGEVVVFPQGVRQSQAAAEAKSRRSRARRRARPRVR